MRDAASRIARAHADLTDVSLADEWAVVSGVVCQHIAMPYPWATTARVRRLGDTAYVGAVDGAPRLAGPRDR